MVCTNKGQLTLFANLSVFEDSDGFYIKDAELFPPQKITFNKLKDIDSYKWLMRYKEEEHELLGESACHSPNNLVSQKCFTELHFSWPINKSGHSNKNSLIKYTSRL